MLGTADTADTHPHAPATDEETRPVRLLVPTRRRGEYYLPPRDTLRASELGLTRHTSDEDLVGMVDAARGLLAGTDWADDPAGWLRWAHDGLRQPRDVAEARAWGLDVPEGENHQEFSSIPRKRLGWWWVYDHSRRETRVGRERRHLADPRRVDMKGCARIIDRAYITVKDRHFEAARLRTLLHEPDQLDEVVRDLAGTGDEVSPAALAEVRDNLRAQIEKDLLKAMTAPVDYAGQSPLFPVGQFIADERLNGRLDEWYEYASIKQTGRPRGSQNKKRTKAQARTAERAATRGE